MADLATLGFSRNSVTIPDRLIINLEGLEKTGKNWFAFTGREPILFVSLDRPSEATVKYFIDQSVEILTYRYPVPRVSAGTPENERINLYRPIWQSIKDVLKGCWGHNEGTLVIDTATECNELSTLARFGKVAQIPPHLRQELNQEWREMFSWAEQADKMSTVFIHKMGEKFDGGGALERKGWGQTSRAMEYAVEANIRTRYDAVTRSFSIQVTDCGPNMSLAGTEMVVEEGCLQALLDLVYA